MKKYALLISVRRFLRGRFDLGDDNATQKEVIERIETGVVIRGINLWVLIFATFIASIGLNVNSTAVIIGAMLISPLMGPIMGLGVALGIKDFHLLQRSVKNFFFMVLISILTSTLYFLISPLTITQSELLARTQPTTWDVLIAFFGGFAGMIAITRNDRTGTVIPGVAIATALMPPLCTAGFGLATAQYSYFFGAFYLFIINTVFIGLSALLTVNLLKYRKVHTLDPAKDKKVTRFMALIIILTVVPSVFIGYDLVRVSVFENNARNYVSKSFNFAQTQVVDYSTTYNGMGEEVNVIEVVLFGDVIVDDTIEALELQMVQFGILNTKLSIKQGSDQNVNLASSFIQKNFEQLIVEKNKKINDLEIVVEQYKDLDIPSAEISKEMSALFNKQVSVSLSKAEVYNYKGERINTILICYVDYDGESFSDEIQTRIVDWLKIRTKINEVKMVFN